MSFQRRSFLESAVHVDLVPYLSTLSRKSCFEVGHWSVRTGFTTALNDAPAALLEDDDMGLVPRTAALNGNNCGMYRFFGKFVRKFDLLNRERAFIHWYVAEGMEEGELAEARMDLGFLEQDYMQVLAELTPESLNDDNY